MTIFGARSRRKVELFLFFITFRLFYYYPWINIRRRHVSVAGLNIWDGTKFIQFLSDQDLSLDLITKIHEDRSGNVWIGTMTDGVKIWDRKGFTQLSMKDGLSSNRISSLLEDKNGNILYKEENK